MDKTLIRYLKKAFTTDIFIETQVIQDIPIVWLNSAFAL